MNNEIEELGAGLLALGVIAAASLGALIWFGFAL